MKSLRELAIEKCYEIRNANVCLASDEDFEKVLTPFDFSEKNGGTFDSYKYYNNFYLYPIIK